MFCCKNNLSNGRFGPCEIKINLVFLHFLCIHRIFKCLKRFLFSYICFLLFLKTVFLYTVLKFFICMRFGLNFKLRWCIKMLRKCMLTCNRFYIHILFLSWHSIVDKDKFSTLYRIKMQTKHFMPIILTNITFLRKKVTEKVTKKVFSLLKR
jgi:hypothetical protein